MGLLLLDLDCGLLSDLDCETALGLLLDLNCETALVLDPRSRDRRGVGGFHVVFLQELNMGGPDHF